MFCFKDLGCLHHVFEAVRQTSDITVCEKVSGQIIEDPAIDITCRKDPTIYITYLNL